MDKFVRPPASKDGLPIHDPTQAKTDVPVFNCIAYLSSTGNTVTARVANLANIEATAGSEREALAKVVAVFKQCVSDRHGREPIAWIEPPLGLKPNERQLLIPVHL